MLAGEMSGGSRSMKERFSYHMRKLKEAGLVREQRRGRWSFYSLDREAARDLLADTGKHLSV